MSVTLPYLYSPRSYQEAVFQAYERNVRRFMTVWLRRGGKDHSSVNFITSRMAERPGTYVHLFPELAMGRRIIWEELTQPQALDGSGGGFNLLEHFAPEFCSDDNRFGRNSSDMTIDFRNGSVYRVMGADMPDRLRGINPVGVVFSEAALMSSKPWLIIEPILTQNKGWAWFQSTPAGDDWFHKLWTATEDDAKWFHSLVTNDVARRDGIAFRRRRGDAEHPEQWDAGIAKAIGEDQLELCWRRGFEAVREDGQPLYLEEEINDMRRRGVDEDWIQQELYCSFGGSKTGSYYGKLMAMARKEDRIRSVPWDPRMLVSTVWDLGVADLTSIWFFQATGREVRIVDYVEDSGKGLDSYVKVVRERPYVYASHWAPHDVKVRELGSGKSRWEIARDLGIQFRVVPNVPVSDGINAVRALLPRCWFDRMKCGPGIEALDNYHSKYSDKLEMYQPYPVHDRWSHGADAFRYLALIVDLEQDWNSRAAHVVVETEFNPLES